MSLLRHLQHSLSCIVLDAPFTPRHTHNDLYCVEWGVKLYSNQPTNILILTHRGPHKPRQSLSGPVNSCIFVAVLYFPVFRLWCCIFLYFHLLLFSVAFIHLLWKYNVYSPLKDIHTSWFLSTVAECGMLRNT